MSDFTYKFWSRQQAESTNHAVAAMFRGHPAFDDNERFELFANAGLAHPIPLVHEEIEELRKDRYKINYRSLKWLAQKLGKSTRTTRRYCEMGLVPSAKRTNGAAGHWRVGSSRKIVASIRRSISSFERKSKPKQISHVHSQKVTKASVSPIPAWHLNAAIARVDPDQAAGLSPLPLSNRLELSEIQTSFEERKSLLKLATENRARTALVIVIARLKANQAKLSASNIASQLLISRSTLYRHISPNLLREIIASA